MTWKDEYRSKCMTANQALGAVRSGGRVWIQSGVGTPSTLVNALVGRAPELRDVEVVHMMTLGSADYTSRSMRGAFGIGGCFWARMCERRWLPAAPITRRSS